MNFPGSVMVLMIGRFAKVEKETESHFVVLTLLLCIMTDVLLCPA